MGHSVFSAFSLSHQLLPGADMPSDTPIFDGLAKQYSNGWGTDAIFYFQHTHRESDTTIGDPDAIIDAFQHLDADYTPLRDVPTYEYPDKPADVPSYTVGHAHNYPYVTSDGKRKSISVTGDEYAVLRVEPFWRE